MNELRKQEMHRAAVASEQGRPGLSDLRKSIPYGRPVHEHYEKEYAANLSRHQSLRSGEIAPRDIPSRPAIYEHRSEDPAAVDKARLMAAASRYNMMSSSASATLPQQYQQPHNVRSTSTPPASTSLHSSNLVLGRADGSILSKISTPTYNDSQRQSTPNEQHKR